MSAGPSRRSILSAAGGFAGAGVLARPLDFLRERRRTRGLVRHAAIGVGGMGAADLEQLASHGAMDVVALCDVDSAHLAAAAKLFPNARAVRDWRELFRNDAPVFDSVNATIPDHMHAPVMLAALRAGKHVYGQKPLTRTVAEARAVARAARRAGSVTQMGIQNHSNAHYSAALELFRAGHIGRVHAVHVWSDRPAGWWPQGVERASGADPVPDTLAWNLWLGVAPERPYKKDLYHPFSWRGFADFGTGAQGDMGCHLMDPALWFLGLAAPLSIRSDGPPPNDESYPLWSRVRYEFPPNALTTRGPLPLTWHDGGKAPKQELEELAAGPVDPNACLFFGEHGALLASPYLPPRLLPAEKFAAVPIPAGTAVNHWHQYVDAVRGKGTTSAPFEYAAFLTEVALLGNVALRFPHETLAWDAKRMRFPERPEADWYLSSPVRKGWDFQES
ncbi:MAG: Gfo/Idh/MocA family oxidoreductase [Planctomycetes bacterium]|nr:Gfo/Idh/MocA family oxidoreductase [Planctomycetota bacterium]